MSRSFKLAALAASVITACATIASAGTLTATQSNVMLKYDPTCSGTPTNINLGSFSITMANATNPNFTDMTAVFTVAGGVPAQLFANAKFHWYQNVETLPPADPATYMGNSASGLLPITDPPSGGWDYMYTDGAGRTTPDPAYSGTFIDNKPWYYTATGEATIGASGGPGTYTIEDEPAKRAGNSPYGVQFLTYFTAEVPNVDCTKPGCLLPNQVMVLGGFAWHTGTNANQDPGIESTFPGPLAGSVADVQAGLNNGGFGAWTAVAGGTGAGAAIICCPEPTSVASLGIGLLLLIRRRPARKAA